MPILPHGPLQQLADNLWVVRGEIKLKNLGRRMTVVRDERGGLFVHNAIMLDEPGFAALEALGPVRAIFVPNRYHDMDAGRMKERYPEAVLCALPAVVTKLKAKFPALAVLDTSLLPRGVSIRPIPGLKGDESVMEIESEGKTTQVYTDALFNLPHGPGFVGLMLRVMGSSGAFKMTGIGKLTLLADRDKFRAFLAEQAARADVTRIVVQHGDVVEGEAAPAFSDAAARL